MVSEVFKVADTLCVLKAIHVHNLPLDLFQQQSALLGEVQLDKNKLADKKILTLEEICRSKSATKGKKQMEAFALLQDLVR